MNCPSLKMDFVIANLYLRVPDLMRLWVVALFVLPFSINAHRQKANNAEEKVSEEPLAAQLPGEVTKMLVSISQPVTLTCGQPSQNLEEHSIAWFYKACGLGPSERPCDSSKDLGGQKMCRESDEEPCPAKLVINKPQPGLYRCYMTGAKSGYTMTATLVNTYQLEIIERKLEPEFVELPEDVEAFAGSSALFMCRIRSNLPLHAKWYKQVPKSTNAIQYENKYYQGLNGTTTSKNGDLHLTKLKFKTVTLADTGVYACGAVNEAGIQYRQARLTVVPVAIQAAPHEPPGHWKMTLFGCAAGFLVILVTSLCCVHLARSSCTRQTRAPRSRPPGLPRRQQPRPVWTPEPETSDYEHVITL